MDFKAIPKFTWTDKSRYSTLHDSYEGIKWWKVYINDLCSSTRLPLVECQMHFTITSGESCWQSEKLAMAAEALHRSFARARVLQLEHRGREAFELPFHALQWATCMETVAAEPKFEKTRSADNQRKLEWIPGSLELKQAAGEFCFVYLNKNLSKAKWHWIPNDENAHYSSFGTGDRKRSLA